MFTPTNEEQAYCKPTHSTKANHKRKKVKDKLGAAGVCPTPYKRSFSSEEQIALFNLPENQYIYRCPCGALHAATDRKKVKA
jgi:hypothetical protein